LSKVDKAKIKDLKNTSIIAPRRPKSYHKKKEEQSVYKVIDERTIKENSSRHFCASFEKMPFFRQNDEGNCAVNPRFLIVRIISISVNLSHIFLILI